MAWFFIALVAPILWSFSNHIDKYIVSRYSTHKSKVGGLIIHTAFSAILVLPIVYLIHPAIFNIRISSIYALIIAGFLNILAILFYLYAINNEEESIVIPFFQLIPVFGYILGYLVFGETLNTKQIIAGLIILFGVVILSINFNKKSKSKIKIGLVLLMASSSLLYALYFVVFKFVAIEENFWTSMFWEEIGMLIIGVLLFLLVKSYRLDFNSLVKNYTLKLFSVNMLNEYVYSAGSFFYNFALLLAPVTMVLLVNAYQPVFVLIIGVALTLFLPKISVEEISGRNFAQKVFAIAVIVLGSVILYM
jgi:drug/metabolite transporter (DMT)-like permease